MNDSIEVLSIAYGSSHDAEECVMKPINGEEMRVEKEQFTKLLSRDDLVALEKTETKWARIRLILMILSIIVWLGLIFAVILLIVFTDKCPPRPNLPFWREKVSYFVNPFAFVDSDEDMVGDIKGLSSKLNYIRDTLGAKVIILSPINAGQLGTATDQIMDFKQLEPELGTMGEFESLIKGMHRKGMHLVISINFNSVPHEHAWLKLPSSKIKYVGASQWKTYDGKASELTLNGEKYYSVDGYNIDLNLRSPEIRKNILNVIEFWLNKGVDGIYLLDCAAYIESDSSTAGQDQSTCYKTTNDQVFQSESVVLVQDIRKKLDEITSSSGRARVLIADNTLVSCAHLVDKNKSEMFLGTKDKPGVHLVINRAFTLDPKKQEFDQLYQNGLEEFDKSEHKTSSAQLIASLVDQRYSNILGNAVMLLLPSVPIIYFGSEIGMESANFGAHANCMYPWKFTTNQHIPRYLHEWSPSTPLAWDARGAKFSSAAKGEKCFSEYLNNEKIVETVESATASSRGPSLFDTVQKLTKLRKSPSLMWGDFKLVNNRKWTLETRFTIFTRSAAGYPAFGILLVKADSNLDSEEGHGVISLSELCPTVCVMLSYPPKNLKENEKLQSDRIYIVTDADPAIHVFKCC